MDNFTNSFKVIKVILPSAENEKIRVLISEKDELHVLTTNDIIFCRADGSYTTIYFTNNRKISLSYNLENTQEYINDDTFFRVHRSFLINISYVSSISRKHNSLIMGNSEEIPVSKGNKTKFINRIVEYKLKSRSEADVKSVNSIIS